MSIKLDLVREEKFCFHFSHVLGNVVDYVNANPRAHVCFGDAQERVRDNNGGNFNCPFHPPLLLPVGCATLVSDCIP